MPSKLVYEIKQATDPDVKFMKIIWNTGTFEANETNKRKTFKVIFIFLNRTHASVKLR